MSRLPAKGRIALLDWVKAAAIVNMVLYHALYDAAFLFGASGAQEFMRSAFAHWWERGICGAFILVSGALALHRRDAGVHAAVFHLVRHPPFSGAGGACYRAGRARPAACAALGRPCRMCGAVLADAHHPLWALALGHTAAAGAV